MGLDKSHDIIYEIYLINGGETEKIIGILQRLLKNILNNNMDKSEKSFYIIIHQGISLPFR